MTAHLDSDGRPDWCAWAMLAKVDPVEAVAFIDANAPALRHLARRYRYDRRWRDALASTREALGRALATYDSSKGLWLSYWDLWARKFAQRDLVANIARDCVTVANVVESLRADDGNPETAMLRHEATRILHEAIGELCYHHREAIRMHLEGQTLTQIGVAMGVSRETIRVRVAQATAIVALRIREGHDVSR